MFYLTTDAMPSCMVSGMKMVWFKATSRGTTSAREMAVNPGCVARVHAYRSSSTQSVIHFAGSPDDFIVVDLPPAEVVAALEAAGDE